MHEQVAEHGVQIAMRLTKLTGRTFFKGILKLLAYMKKNNQEIKQSVKKGFENLTNGSKENTGKQTVKQLVGQGQGVSSIELDAVKGFDKYARKYGVDYAVRKGDDGKYLVFFKGKDADALTAAFSEFTSKKLNRSERPPLKDRIAKAKERAAQRKENKLKNRNKEQSL